MTCWLRIRETAVAATAACLITACSGDKPQAAATTGGTPTRGGTLKLIGKADIDHMSTSAAYYTTTSTLLRGMARQLIAYSADTDFDRQAQVAPDLVTVVPSLANGGISADGKTYTFHLRSGAKWNSTPPRAVTAADEVRGIKLLCNPVS